MKYKRTILILLIFIIFFVYIGHPLAEKKMMNNYEDRLIRFHIRANSDREEDQELKFKIRDRILAEMGDKFGETESLKESRKIIRENIDEMKSIAEDTIAREGKNYRVEINLGKDKFPTRRYGNLILPQGEYETLLISLGQAKGKNWWCVMFPPLCFVDITHSVAYNAKEDVERVEVDTEVDTEDTEEVELKLKWKVVDLLEKIKIK